MLLRRFFITLLFSWMANPLGVAIAQWLGVTQQPALILILLASGTCVPFQILLNEAIAVRVKTRDPLKAHQLLAIIVGVQALTCAAALLALPTVPVSPGVLLAVVSTTATTSIASFLCTRRYYALATAGAITPVQAALFGAIPGMVALVLYLAAGLSAGMPQRALDALLMSVALLPTVVVWVYIAWITPSGFASLEPALDLPPAPSIVGVLLGLIALTFIGTRLRADLATLHSHYAAVIVVLLNSMASLMTTVTRAFFFRGKHQSASLLIPLIAAVAGVLGLALSDNHPGAAKFAWLVSAQAMIIALIEIGRRSGLQQPQSPAGR